jgi:hypothetical protein
MNDSPTSKKKGKKYLITLVKRLWLNVQFENNVSFIPKNAEVTLAICYLIDNII